MTVPGLYDIALRDTVGVYSNRFRYWFLKDSQLSYSFPKFGSWNSTVNVFGANFTFWTDDYMSCRFGLDTVAATFISSDILKCSVPATLHEGHYRLSVSPNSRDYTPRVGSDTGERVLYEAITPFTITSISPDSGPTIGHRLVRYTAVSSATYAGLGCQKTPLVMILPAAEVILLPRALDLNRLGFHTIRSLPFCQPSLGDGGRGIFVLFYDIKHFCFVNSTPFTHVWKMKFAVRRAYLQN